MGGEGDDGNQPAGILQDMIVSSAAAAFHDTISRCHRGNPWRTAAAIMSHQNHLQLLLCLQHFHASTACAPCLSSVLMSSCPVCLVSCAACPAGRYSLNGEPSCRDCPKGSWW